MAFAFDIAQVVTSLGMTHASAQKDPQRLVVVQRATRAVGDPLVNRNWYWCRGIIEGERCQHMERELIECVEEELQAYP